MDTPPLDPRPEPGREARDPRPEPAGESRHPRPPRRREDRTRSVRLAECAPFPRTSSDQRWCSGVTLDVSRSGLRLRLGAGAPPDSLVRVRVRDLEGRVELDGLARVVWCRDGGGSCSLLGLSVLADSIGLLDAPRTERSPGRDPALLAVCA